MSRKPFKHSKRFERTQKGCLTCRHKKKKCDGIKPVCESCAKRGLLCQYPENIRMFSVNSLQGSFAIEKPQRMVSTSPKRSNSTTSVSTTSSASSIAKSVPLTPQSCSDLTMLSQVLQTNTAEANSAIALSRNGESIKEILDNIAIDVIKRSIETLQYVDWDKKIKTKPKQEEPQSNTWAIMEGLKFKEEESAGHSWLDDDFLKVQDHIV